MKTRKRKTETRKLLCIFQLVVQMPVQKTSLWQFLHKNSATSRCHNWFCWSALLHIGKYILRQFISVFSYIPLFLKKVFSILTKRNSRNEKTQTPPPINLWEKYIIYGKNNKRILQNDLDIQGHGKNPQPSNLGVIELIQISLGEKLKVKQDSKKACLKGKCLLHTLW